MPGSPAGESRGGPASSSPAWRYFEIDSNHMLASNRPQETAAILAQVASGA